jgi:hypothetical protein
MLRTRDIATALAVVLTLGVLTFGAPAAANSAETNPAVQLAQYYPYGGPPPYYYGGGPPPCAAVNNPWGGAARGAAGGAIIGAIAGDAGKGAAIGAGIGLFGRAIRNSNARANGYCY